MPVCSYLAVLIHMMKNCHFIGRKEIIQFDLFQVSRGCTRDVTKSKELWDMAKRELSGEVPVKVNCPGCKRICVKFGTNNHIQCLSCKQEFCFLCGETFRGGKVKNKHFSGKCKLHSDDTVPLTNKQSKTR